MLRCKVRVRLSRTRFSCSESITHDRSFRSHPSKRYIPNLGRIGRTFMSKSKLKQFNCDDPHVMEKYKKQKNFGFDENKPEFKHGRWCYDTPGTIQPDQVLDLLTTEELMSVLPKQIIAPRTFLLYPDQTIFLAGLGRLDYLEGEGFIRYPHVYRIADVMQM